MAYPKTGNEVFVSFSLSNTMFSGIGKGTITREEVSADYLKDLFGKYGVIVSAKPEQRRLLELINERYGLELEIPESLKIVQLSEKNRRIVNISVQGVQRHPVAALAQNGAAVDLDPEGIVPTALFVTDHLGVAQANALGARIHDLPVVQKRGGHSVEIGIAVAQRPPQSGLGDRNGDRACREGRLYGFIKGTVFANALNADGIPFQHGVGGREAVFAQQLRFVFKGAERSKIYLSQAFG